MEFRQATAEDLPQIKAVYGEIVRDMREKQIDIWDDIYPCAFFEKDIRENAMYVLVDGEVVTAGFVLRDNDPGSESVRWTKKARQAMYLDRLGVNVRYARKGVGSTALKMAEETAAELGADALRLFVVDVNLPAIGLYEKNGYSKADGIYDAVIDEGFMLHEYGYEKELF